MTLPKLRGNYYEPSFVYLKNFPIRKIDTKNKRDIETHGKIVCLVERMLSLHKQSKRTPQAKEVLQREIEATDKQIDKLVYELYGLTEEEIKIVEDGI
jgi:hypothetical protein